MSDLFKNINSILHIENQIHSAVERHEREQERNEQRTLTDLARKGTEADVTKYLHKHEGDFTTQQLTSAIRVSESVGNDRVRDALFDALDDKAPGVKPILTRELSRIAKEGTGAELTAFVKEHGEAIDDKMLDIAKRSAQQRELTDDKKNMLEAINTELHIPKQENVVGAKEPVKNPVEQTPAATVATAAPVQNEHHASEAQPDELKRLAKEGTSKEMGDYLKVHKAEISPKELSEAYLVARNEHPASKDRSQILDSFAHESNGQTDVYSKAIVVTELYRLAREGNGNELRNYIQEHQAGLEVNRLSSAQEFAAARDVKDPNRAGALAAIEHRLKELGVDKEQEQAPAQPTKFNVAEHVNSLGFESKNDHHHKRADGRADVDVKVAHDKAGHVHVLIDGKELAGKEALQEILKHNKENAYHIHNDHGDKMSFKDMSEELGNLPAPSFKSGQAPVAKGNGRH